MKEGLHSADTKLKKNEKGMKKVPNQTWTGWNWMPSQWLNSDFLDGTRNGFWCSDLKAKLYRKKCSMPAFLQNSCRRAGCKTNKTLANVLIVLGSCPRRRWPIPNLQHLWLWAPGCAKRKIKHISDARFTVVKGSGAGQTWVVETASMLGTTHFGLTSERLA